MPRQPVMFDELPEELQVRLAERNPELRAYRNGIRDESQVAYDAAIARRDTAWALVHAHRQRPPAVPLAVKLLGLGGTVIALLIAAGGH